MEQKQPLHEQNWKGNCCRSRNVYFAWKTLQIITEWSLSIPASCLILLYTPASSFLALQSIIYNTMKDRQVVCLQRRDSNHMFSPQ